MGNRDIPTDESFDLWVEGLLKDYMKNTIAELRSPWGWRCYYIPTDEFVALRLDENDEIVILERRKAN